MVMRSLLVVSDFIPSAETAGAAVGFYPPAEWRSSVVGGPRGEQAAIVRDEPLVLVRRKRRRHGVDEHRVELRRREPRVRQLVQMREMCRAELGVGAYLEVLVGELAVLRQLLRVRQVVAVAVLE